MRDLPLYLPEGVYLRALTINANFNVISYLMQRAIVLLTCGEYDGLKIEDKNIIEFLQSTTTAAIDSVAMRLSDIADHLKSYLNTSLDNERYNDETVDSVEFTITVEDAIAEVTLTIRRAVNNESESMVVYRYE